MNDAALWSRRVADWQASGLSALAFSRSKQLQASELRKWGKALAVAPVPRGSETRVTMARVVAVSGPVAASPTPASLVVEVGDARIVVPPDFDGRALRSVIAILASRRAAS
jgi:transposase